MRVLVVHNYYGSESPSGENNAVDAEISMLRRHGHDVETFTRSSDEIRGLPWTGAIRGGLAVAWNPFESFRFKRYIADVKPDIVHVHNTFPLISPAVFWAMDRRIACVLTLHNYRLFCAAAMLMRAGRPCTQCLDRSSVLPALRFGCYRGSRIATLPLASGIAIHKAIGTWHSKVSAFIAFTEYQRNKLVGAGLPADKLFVKPQAFIGVPTVVPWELRDNAAVYVGRLAEEKGVTHLVNAWIDLGDSGPALRIIGDGPLRGTLQQMAKASGRSNISFLGTMSSEDATRETSRARLLIIPSSGIEAFPMVLLDALASGTPCAVSNLGSLPTIISSDINGLIFEPNSSGAIARLIRTVWGNEHLLADLAVGARSSFEQQYTETMNHKRLMDIYSNAISRFSA